MINKTNQILHLNVFIQSYLYKNESIHICYLPCSNIFLSPNAFLENMVWNSNFSGKKKLEIYDGTLNSIRILSDEIVQYPD